MATIPKGATVAVTGSAGFIGSWVVRRLLDKGYRVRACVRDVDDSAKTDFLKEMPGYASGRLTLHGANLDTAGCFDEIFEGCHGVCHVSHVSDYNDQDYASSLQVPSLACATMSVEMHSTYIAGIDAHGLQSTRQYHVLSLR